MKTNTYNKTEHVEGYVGSGKNHEPKSDVQKDYERGNEGNEVPIFGKESLPDSIVGNPNARDGFDNTGTQGKDSLSDDPYVGLNLEQTVKGEEGKTDPSPDDCFNKNNTDHPERDEDDVLNTGI